MFGSAALEVLMFSSAKRRRIGGILTGPALTGLLVAALMTDVEAQPAVVPNFSSNQVGWIAMHPDFVTAPGGPSPSRSDPAHPYVPNNAGAQPTFRIADLTNPNLKPWAKAVMKKENEKVLAGKNAYTPRSSCMPAGVPNFMSFIVEPVFIIQSPREVLIIYSGNQEVRHVYLDMPHSEKPKPSWYGESVGHYEGGNTLVIDTIGFNDWITICRWRISLTSDCEPEPK